MSIDTVAVGKVGPSLTGANLADGVDQVVRLGKTGEQVVAELHGKYTEAVMRGNAYWATMSAGVIFPAPANLTNNPMSLANPLNSGKNLILISFVQVVTVLPVAAIVSGGYALYVNSNPQATPVSGTTITPVNALLGSANVPVGKAFSTSTIPAAPTLWLPYGQKVVGELAASFPNPGLPTFQVDFDGKMILGPGSAVTPQLTSADATNATVICGFCWEEVPV